MSTCHYQVICSLCCLTAIHKSSPVATQDNKVAISCTLQNLTSTCIFVQVIFCTDFAHFFCHIKFRVSMRLQMQLVTCIIYKHELPSILPGPSSLLKVRRKTTPKTPPSKLIQWLILFDICNWLNHFF